MNFFIQYSQFLKKDMPQTTIFISLPLIEAVFKGTCIFEQFIIIHSFTLQCPNVKTFNVFKHCPGSLFYIPKITKISISLVKNIQNKCSFECHANSSLTALETIIKLHYFYLLAIEVLTGSFLILDLPSDHS